MKMGFIIARNKSLIVTMILLIPLFLSGYGYIGKGGWKNYIYEGTIGYPLLRMDVGIARGIGAKKHDLGIGVGIGLANLDQCIDKKNGGKVEGLIPLYLKVMIPLSNIREKSGVYYYPSIFQLSASTSIFAIGGFDSTTDHELSWVILNGSVEWQLTKVMALGIEGGFFSMKEKDTGLQRSNFYFGLKLNAPLYYAWVPKDVVRIFPPQISIFSQITDTDGDGVLRAGDKGEIEVTLSNSANSKAVGGRLLVELISSDYSGLVKYPMKIKVPKVPANGEAKVRIPIEAIGGLPKGEMTFRLMYKGKAEWGESVEAMDEVSIKTEPRGGLAERPPYLEVKAFDIKDENGNGVFEAGEKARVRVVIKNSGKGDAYGVGIWVDGFFRSEVDRVSIIKRGEEIEREFEFRVPLKVKTGEKRIRLMVDAGEYSPEPVVVKFYTHALIPPSFNVVVRVDDDREGLSLGNGNGKIEPRETIELHVKVRNEGKGMAKGVKIEGEAESEGIRMVKSEDVLGNIVPGGELEGRLAFFVPYGYKGKDVKIGLKIKESTGLWTVKKEMRFPVGELTERSYVIKPTGEIQEGGEFRSVIKVEKERAGLPEVPLFQDPRRYALIIGVSNYMNVSKLPTPVNDARLMREMAVKIMGVKPGNLRYMENPTLAEMKKGLQWLKEQVRKGGMAIIYFSGHGAVDEEGNAYWLPVDADQSITYIPETAMRVDEIYKRFRGSRRVKVLVIGDVCYAGKGKGVMLAGAKPLVVVKEPKRGENYTVLLSSRADEISAYLEDVGYSVFTYALYKTLTTGDVLDRDGDGYLEVNEIRGYLEKKTEEYARRVGVRQEPVIEGLNLKLSQVVE